MSCAKEEVQPERTLIENLSLEQRNSNDTILLFQKLLSNNPNELKKINEKKYGSPSWKDVLLSKQTMFLPYYKPNTKEVLGVLIGHLDKINKRTYFIFLEKDKIKTLKTESQVKNLNNNKPFTQEYAASVFLVLDKKIFNATDCGLVTIVKGNNFTDNSLEERACSWNTIIEPSGWDVFLGGNLVYSYREFTTTYKFVCDDGGSGGFGSGGGYVDPTDWTVILTSGGGVDCTNPNNACLSQCLDCLGRSKTCVECTVLNIPDVIQCGVAFDNIIIESSFTQCKALNCVYRHLSGSNSSLFCGNIENTFGPLNSKIDLRIATFDGSSVPGWTTLFNGNGKMEVTLTFGGNQCYGNNPDYLDMAETILHESIHAKFRFDFYNSGMNEANYKSEFSKFMNNKYGVPYNDHDIMLKNYMDILAAELRQINNNKFDNSYYMYYVYVSLERSNLAKNITNDQKTDWLNKQQKVKQNNPWKCN